MESDPSFDSIGHKLQAEKGQLFGKPCYKLNKKAFICWFEGEMVFKLPESVRHEVLALDEVKLFDPSGKNRPMKEWVQVPGQHSEKWEALAKEAMEYVRE